MKRKLIWLLLTIISVHWTQAQETTLRFDTEVPAQNLLKFNRFLINPTFSTVREDKSYINLYHRNENGEFNNARDLYFISYSGRMGDRTGFGLSLFQQKFGTFSNFGAMANYGYGVRLAEKSALSFGFNLQYYNSGYDASEAVPGDLNDPLLAGLEDGSFLSFQPGINLAVGSFDFGVYAENLLDYNFKTSESLTDFKDKTYSAHLQYTKQFENAEGMLEQGRLMALTRGRKKGEEDVVLSGSLILDLPKIGWLQGGYDDFYGASAGIGFNVTKRLSLGYTIEKGLNDGRENLGPTHEVSFAYSFEPNLTEDRVMLEEDYKDELAQNQQEFLEKDEEISALKQNIQENNEIIAELIYRQDSIEQAREKDLERRFAHLMRFINKGDQNQNSGNPADALAEYNQKDREAAIKKYGDDTQQNQESDSNINIASTPDNQNVNDNIPIGTDEVSDTSQDINTEIANATEEINESTVVANNQEEEMTTVSPDVVVDEIDTNEAVVVNETNPNDVPSETDSAVSEIMDDLEKEAEIDAVAISETNQINEVNSEASELTEDIKKEAEVHAVAEVETTEEVYETDNSVVVSDNDNSLEVAQDNTTIYNSEPVVEEPVVVTRNEEGYTKAKKRYEDAIDREAINEKVKSRRVRNLTGVTGGYYIVANVYKGNYYFNKFMNKLEQEGMSPRYFINPENGMKYVYLKRFDNWQQALASYKSKVDGQYSEDIWIMSIDNGQNDSRYANHGNNTDSYISPVDNTDNEDNTADQYQKQAGDKKEYDPTILQKNVVKKSTVNKGTNTSNPNKGSVISNSNLQDGYYIIANVFAVPGNAAKFVNQLKSQGLNAEYFINPDNNYRYVYLQTHNTWNNALASYKSNLDNSYHDEVWIMRVNNNLML